MAFVECKPQEVAGALALYRERPPPFEPNLILAVLEGIQSGRVYVDDAHRPRAAFVVTGFGFCAVFGEETDEFRGGMARTLEAADAPGPKYLLWYAPPREWASKLDSLAPGAVRRRERVRFAFDPNRASYLRDEERCPRDLRLTELTADLLPKARCFNLEIESRFWSSADDFLAHGVGVGLFRGDELLSLCYSACVVDAHAEVDVATSADHRGQGYASVVTREFARVCRRRGITPAWDAFSQNEQSVRLAKSIGFVPRIAYDFYTFSTPLRLTAETRIE